MKTITWSIIKENIFNDIKKYFMDMHGPNYNEFCLYNIESNFRRLEGLNGICTKNDYNFTKSIKNEKIKTLLMMYMDMSYEQINDGWKHRKYIYIKENEKDDINNIILKYLSKI